MRENSSSFIPSPITNQVTVYKDRVLVFTLNKIMQIISTGILNEPQKLAKQELS